MKSVDINNEDLSSFLESFRSESDRAAAVLAGSVVDNFLAKYLQSNMINDPCVVELFGGFGPFASFKQRVDSAYALGFISEAQKKSLNSIGKIRNHFAHHPFDAAFDKPPVCGWCENLARKYVVAGDLSDIKQENRNRYLVAIMLCISNWQIRMKHQNK